MTRQIISTPDAPRSPLFSQGVRIGSTLSVSGTVGVDTTTGDLAGTSIESQTTQALRNCESVLKAAGCTLDDVTMVTVLLARPADFAGMNEAYAAVFPTDPPARAVARLGPELPGILVSVAMTAQTGV
jgi:2-iminobutanoate/2-iminopropanoate deaminase